MKTTWPSASPTYFAKSLEKKSKYSIKNPDRCILKRHDFHKAWERIILHFISLVFSYM